MMPQSDNLLWIKLSSLGDIVHAFAAIHDVAIAYPSMRIGWAVEEAFADLVANHPDVDTVVTVPIRRLRQNGWNWCVWQHFLQTLRNENFTIGIDAQGLLKSAIVLRIAKVQRRLGYNARSAREALASRMYRQTIAVEKNQHAVTRMRQLASQALDMPQPTSSIPDYGLSQWQAPHSGQILLLHGTTWPSKLLPESHWHAIIRYANAAGYAVQFTWGNAVEKVRAERLASVADNFQILPAMSLNSLHAHLYTVDGVISVDSGLGHLAAACGVPALGVFGPTDVNLTGFLGKNARNIGRDSPCFCKDCRQHGAQSAQECMAYHTSEQIWHLFLQLQAEVSHA